MGIRHTGDVGTRVALYDSVTEWAFGPTFDSPTEAEHFLEWAEARREETWGPLGRDLRALSDSQLGQVHEAWLASVARRELLDDLNPSAMP